MRDKKGGFCITLVGLVSFVENTLFLSSASLISTLSSNMGVIIISTGNGSIVIKLRNTINSKELYMKERVRFLSLFLSTAMVLVGCGGESANNTVSPVAEATTSVVVIASSVGGINKPANSAGASSSHLAASYPAVSSSYFSSSSAPSLPALMSSSAAVYSSFSNTSAPSQGAVCGWVPFDDGTSEYVSFNSEAAAVAANAKVVRPNFGCGKIAGKKPYQHQPLIIVNETLIAGLPVVIGDVSIDGDVLHVELTYSACQETALSMVSINGLLASWPYQASYGFVGETGSCGLQFTSRFIYDLTPLQSLYAMPSSYNLVGEILLRDIGSYLF